MEPEEVSDIVDEHIKEDMEITEESESLTHELNKIANEITDKIISHIRNKYK